MLVESGERVGSQGGARQGMCTRRGNATATRFGLSDFMPVRITDLLRLSRITGNKKKKLEDMLGEYFLLFANSIIQLPPGAGTGAVLSITMLQRECDSGRQDRGTRGGTLE